VVSYTLVFGPLTGVMFIILQLTNQNIAMCSFVSNYVYLVVKFLMQSFKIKFIMKTELTQKHNRDCIDYCILQYCRP